MAESIRQKDTQAWVIQVWAAFTISLLAMAWSVISLPIDRPIDNWMKGQLATTFLFAISSTFTLSKTIRDNHEASKLVARIDEAKVEKILTENKVI